MHRIIQSSSFLSISFLWLVIRWSFRRARGEKIYIYYENSAATRQQYRSGEEQEEFFASLALCLFHFRLRSPNCRLSYTRHVILLSPSSFRLSFCCFSLESRRQGTQHGLFVGQERTRRYGGARGKILGKIVGETIRRCFANYVASSLSRIGLWRDAGEDAVMSAYFANDAGALCRLVRRRVHGVYVVSKSALCLLYAQFRARPLANY